jgi:RNA polymerase sigma factor FliA
MVVKGKLLERDDLISAYKIYVRNLVYKLVRIFGLPSVNLDEYIAAGYLGLVEAAERYDVGSNLPFKPFAFLRIRGSIIDSIRRTTHLSGPAYRLSRALQAANDLQEELRYAQETHSDRNNKHSRLLNILEYAAQGALIHRLSICEVQAEVEEIIDETENAEEQLENFDDKKIIRELVETLPEKERTILREHYINGKSFMDIVDGNEGMSKSWVSRLHKRAINRLKQRYYAIIRCKNTIEDFMPASSAEFNGLQGEHRP